MIKKMLGWLLWVTGWLLLHEGGVDEPPVAFGRPAHAQHVYLPFYQGHMTYTRKSRLWRTTRLTCTNCSWFICINKGNIFRSNLFYYNEIILVFIVDFLCKINYWVIYFISKPMTFVRVNHLIEFISYGLIIFFLQIFFKWMYFVLIN